MKNTLLMRLLEDYYDLFNRLEKVSHKSNSYKVTLKAIGLTSIRIDNALDEVADNAKQIETIYD